MAPDYCNRGSYWYWQIDRLARLVRLVMLIESGWVVIDAGGWTWALLYRHEDAYPYSYSLPLGGDPYSCILHEWKRVLRKRACW